MRGKGGDTPATNAFPAVRMRGSGAVYPGRPILGRPTMPGRQVPRYQPMFAQPNGTPLPQPGRLWVDGIRLSSQ